MSAFLAPSLVALRGEINSRWPGRDRSSDGWIGDAAHSSRESDHNPDERGEVHAIDVDKDGIDVDELLRAVVGDPRVWYVIHNGIIRSRTYGWEARKYTGSNPHEKHVHVSIRYTAAAETDTRTWLNTRSAPARTKGLPVVDLGNVSGQLGKVVNGRGKVATDLPGMRLVQRALNDRLKLERAHRLDVDGTAGPLTASALAAYQRRLRSLGVTGTGSKGIPNRLDLERLGRGRFTVRGSAK